MKFLLLFQIKTDIYDDKQYTGSQYYVTVIIGSGLLFLSMISNNYI